MIEFVTDLKCILKLPHTYKWLLLRNFICIYLQSFMHYRFGFFKQKQAKLLSYVVDFNDYSTFIYLIREVFIYECYPVWKLSTIQKVIDGGSHIGMAILYFKTHFPHCHIVAFEPMAANRLLLIKNCTQNHLQHIVIESAALGFSPAKASISSLEKDISSRVAYSENGDIIIEPLSNHISQAIDLLKLDVEGMEHDVINDLKQTNKLNSITHFFIELRKEDTTINNLLRNEGFEAQESASHFYKKHPESVYLFSKNKALFG